MTNFESDDAWVMCTRSSSLSPRLQFYTACVAVYTTSAQTFARSTLVAQLEAMGSRYIAEKLLVSLAKMSVLQRFSRTPHYHTREYCLITFQGDSIYAEAFSLSHSVSTCSGPGLRSNIDHENICCDRPKVSGHESQSATIH